MDSNVICAACGVGGFLADKVSLFPFLLGGVLGAMLTVSLPSGARHRVLARLQRRHRSTPPSECSTAPDSDAMSEKED